MTGRRATWLIARREVVERVRTRGFRISTALSIAVVVALAVVPGILRDDDATSYDIALAGAPSAADARAFEDALRTAARSQGDVELEVDGDLAAEDAEAAAERDGGPDAVVDLAAGRIVVAESLGDQLGAIIQAAHAQVGLVDGLEDAGVGPEEAVALLDGEPLAVDALDAPSEVNEQRSGVTFVATILLFGQIFGFGFYVASGVVEEKASRVMEVLLSRVSPTQLLAGKIIGIGVLGLGQLVLFATAGLVAGSVSGTFTLPSEVLPVAPLVVGWFVLGFALYACLFAMGGALASRSEDLQSTTGPITLIAMASYLGAIATSGDPGGTAARVVSLLPPAAPLLMPTRIVAGEAAGWEVGLSLALLVAAIAVLLPLTARVHAGAALVTSTQVKLRQALRSGDA